MQAATLAEAMPGLSAARAARLVAGANMALRLGGMTTVRRAAMFLAQVGEESGSLIHTEEIASGQEYEGRLDLGNVSPGDGPRYKGRSFIQITGRANYSQFSLWAHAKGLVADSAYFVDHPEQLASDTWAWLGPVWYFAVARPNLNQLADLGDLVLATREINGGLNGYADRLARWQRCLALGEAILPDPPLPPPVPTTDWLDMASKADLTAVVRSAAYPDLYVKFVGCGRKNDERAIYRVEGGQLRLINAPTYASLGNPPVRPQGTWSNFWTMPIVPGTPDLRGT